MYFFFLIQIELLSWDGEDISPKKDGSIIRRTITDGEEDIFPVKGNLLCSMLLNFFLIIKF